MCLLLGLTLIVSSRETHWKQANTYNSNSGSSYSMQISTCANYVFVYDPTKSFPPHDHERKREEEPQQVPDNSWAPTEAQDMH